MSVEPEQKTLEEYTTPKDRDTTLAAVLLFDYLMLKAARGDENSMNIAFNEWLALLYEKYKGNSNGHYAVYYILCLNYVDYKRGQLDSGLRARGTYSGLLDVIGAFRSFSISNSFRKKFPTVLAWFPDVGGEIGDTLSLDYAIATTKDRIVDEKPALLLTVSRKNAVPDGLPGWTTEEDPGTIPFGRDMRQIYVFESRLTGATQEDDKTIMTTTMQGFTGALNDLYKQGYLVSSIISWVVPSIKMTNKNGAVKQVVLGGANEDLIGRAKFELDFKN